MTPPSTSGSRWNLARDVARNAQGLVTSGFSDLSAACALLLSAGTLGGAWIEALKKVAPVTAADGPRTPSVALAFTSLGLARLGLRQEIIDQFSLPFVEGMMQKDRRRSLGDVDEKGEPLGSVAWGLRSQPDTAPGTAATKQPIHALLMVYHESHGQLSDLLEQQILPALSAQGVEVARRIALDLSVGGGDIHENDVREHFGFVDGISQPIPCGAGTDDGSGKQVAQDPLHGVPLGEILLGHPDAHGTTSTGPLLADAPVAAAASVSAGSAAIKAVADAMKVLPDLGLNGSYLVVRELRQDVDAFWASMEKAAADLDVAGSDASVDGTAAPGAPSPKAKWLAERVIGRTLDGHMLRPDGHLPPRDGLPDNDFLYFLRDRTGYGCPMGSHVRRANPRDGLAYGPEVCEDLLRSANAHRLLRRGRKYGPDITNKDTSGKTKSDTGDDVGLFFICLNGDIARQFEFVQQNWMLNTNFATLYDEVDPLVGPKGKMTLPARPLRRRVEVATFVTLVGGDYFFLPSLPTLDILAKLRPA